jgi:transposase
MEPVAQVSEVSDEVVIDIPASAALTTSSDNHAAPFVAVVHASTPLEAAPPAMKMSLTLHVRLSNGVELELGSSIATIDELTTVVQILGRLPCSGSTKS